MERLPQTGETPSARDRKLLGQKAQARFRRFEGGVVIVGSLAIIGSALSLFLSTGNMHELLGQLLLLPVLFVSLNYGRVGGISSALIASLIFWFAGLKQPGQPVHFELIELFGVRAFSYFIIGFVGGEVMSAVRYYFARSGGLGGVDPESGLYVADFLTGMVERAILLYERYAAPFSLVILDLDKEAVVKSDRFQADRDLQSLGELLKANLRIVDEIGRLDDYTFAVLMSHTALSGAQAASERIANEIANHYEVPVRQLITTRVYSVPEHLVELRELVGLPSSSAAPLVSIGKIKGA